jgi:hypothetical protein
LKRLQARTAKQMFFTPPEAKSILLPTDVGGALAHPWLAADVAASWWPQSLVVISRDPPTTQVQQNTGYFHH